EAGASGEGARAAEVWRGGISPQNAPIFLRCRQEQLLHQMRKWRSAFPQPFDMEGSSFIPRNLREARVGGEGTGTKIESSRRLASLLVSASPVTDSSQPPPERLRFAGVGLESPAEAGALGARDGERDAVKQPDGEFVGGKVERKGELEAGSRRGEQGVVSHLQRLRAEGETSERGQLEGGFETHGQRRPECQEDSKRQEEHTERTGEQLFSQGSETPGFGVAEVPRVTEVKPEVETGTVNGENKSGGDVERSLKRKKKDRKKRRELSAESDGDVEHKGKKRGREQMRPPTSGGDASDAEGLSRGETDEQVEPKRKRKPRKEADLEPLSPSSVVRRSQVSTDPASPESCNRLSSSLPSGAPQGENLSREEKKKTKFAEASALECRKREKKFFVADSRSRGGEGMGPSSGSFILDANTPRIPRKKTRMLDDLEDEPVAGSVGGQEKRGTRPKSLEEVDPWLTGPAPQKFPESPQARIGDVSVGPTLSPRHGPQPSPPARALPQRPTPHPEFPPASQAAFPRFNRPGPAFGSDREGSQASRWGSGAQRAGRPGDPVSGEVGCQTLTSVGCP
ncbi:putative retinitis pigmentosa 1-1-like protein, partial [Toxoplasma gondii TgCatPRC2]